MKIRGVNKVTQYQFSYQIPPASLFSINLSHLKRPNEVISQAQKCLYHKISNYRQQSLRSLLGKCARAVDILFSLVRRLSIYRQGEKKALSATLSDKPFFHQGPASMRRGRRLHTHVIVSFDFLLFLCASDRVRENAS